MAINKDWNLPKPKGGAFTVSFRAGHGYAVLSPKGEMMAKGLTEADARRICREHQSEADRKAKRGPRPCMCCGTAFVSEGIHNRMCGRCRGATEALGEPQRPYISRKAS